MSHLLFAHTLLFARNPSSFISLLVGDIIRLHANKLTRRYCPSATKFADKVEIETWARSVFVFFHSIHSRLLWYFTRANVLVKQQDGWYDYDRRMWLRNILFYHVPVEAGKKNPQQNYFFLLENIQMLAEWREKTKGVERINLIVQETHITLSLLAGCYTTKLLWVFLWNIRTQ